MNNEDQLPPLPDHLEQRLYDAREIVAARDSGRLYKQASSGPREQATVWVRVDQGGLCAAERIAKGYYAVAKLPKKRDRALKELIALAHCPMRHEGKVCHMEAVRVDASAVKLCGRKWWVPQSELAYQDYNGNWFPVQVPAEEGEA